MSPNSDENTIAAVQPSGSAPRALGQLNPWRQSILRGLVETALISIILAIVYGPSTQAPFVFDDIQCIQNNPSIMRLWPLWGEFGQSPLRPPHDYNVAGRPLVNLSLAINVAVGGLNPAGFHWFNLFLHLLSTLLVAAITRGTLLLPYFAGKFNRSATILSFLVALLWALHPLQTEAVEYISQRTELMMGLFYLAVIYGSLRFYTARLPQQRWLWGLCASIACVLGMACKEVMVTAPVVALLFERTFVSGSFRNCFRNSWPLYVNLTWGWWLLLLLNLSGPRAASAGFHVEIPAYIWWMTQAKVLWTYLKLAVWPWPLIIHYEVPYLTTLQSAWPWILATGVLIIASIVLALRRYSAGFVGASALLILSPTLVVPIITEIAAERRMYLPLAPLTALAVVGGYRLLVTRFARLDEELASPRFDRALATNITACGSVSVLWAILSLNRLSAYESAMTLWKDAAQHQPDNYFVQTNLGVELLNNGHPAEAIEHFEHALRFGDRDAAKIHTDFGAALVNLGRLPEAIKHFRESIRLKPDYWPAEVKLGYALHNVGNPQEAVVHFRRALGSQSDAFEIHKGLGAALVNAGRPLEAIQHLSQAATLKPGDFELERNLGLAYGNAGQMHEAIAHLQTSLKLQPDAPGVHQFLAVALNNTGRHAEAIEHLQQAMLQGPPSADLHQILGVTLFNVGRRREAIAEFERALRIDPHHAAAKASLEQMKQLSP